VPHVLDDVVHEVYPKLDTHAASARAS